MQTKENELIKQVKKGDDEALKELFELYQPLVNKVLKGYYLRHYDQNDWQQEAMIICYESAMVYSGQKGNFAGLYKAKLTNHARTLVRYHTALRRKMYNTSVSLDRAKLQSINEPKLSQLAIPIGVTYNNFVKSLSRLELIALLTILGEMSIEHVINHLNIEAVKLLRARSRIIKKMRNVLF